MPTSDLKHSFLFLISIWQRPVLYVLCDTQQEVHSNRLQTVLDEIHSYWTALWEPQLAIVFSVYKSSKCTLAAAHGPFVSAFSSQVAPWSSRHNQINAGVTPSGFKWNWDELASTLIEFLMGFSWEECSPWTHATWSVVQCKNLNDYNFCLCCLNATKNNRKAVYVTLIYIHRGL